jgi:Flp pilus assembly protein TadG
MNDVADVDVRVARRFRGDRGAADGGLEIMFGAVAMIFFVLLIVETVSYWHSRNVFDEAAAEGARVAAAFDGTCTAGSSTARTLLERRAGGWSSGVTVGCSEADGIVTITISGTTPGVLFDAAGFTATVTQSAPRER